MSMPQADFQGEVTICATIWRAYANRNAEMTAVATALGTDTTTHDKTIEAAPLALRIGPANSYMTNDLLLLVNIAKGGNLSTAAMATAINAVVAANP